MRANVYCEIIPYHKKIEPDPSLKGVILSGSPFSVNDPQAPEVNIKALHQNVPILGICYGAQLTAREFGGRVANSSKREYGRALLSKTKDDVILHGVSDLSQVWMSHADTILELPAGFDVLPLQILFHTPLSGITEKDIRYTVYNFTRKYIIPLKGRRLSEISSWMFVAANRIGQQPISSTIR